MEPCVPKGQVKYFASYKGKSNEVTSKVVFVLNLSEVSQSVAGGY